MNLNYSLKVIVTEDRQLDGLNIVLEFETLEQTFAQAKVFIEQGYTIAIKEIDVDEDQG